MSVKANPAVIGTFVLVGALVAAGAIILLSTGRVFRDSVPYVLYFQGDLSGLDEGAPVSFQGVTVGQVTDIAIVYDHATKKLSRPVEIEIRRDVFVLQNVEDEVELDSAMPAHIERGLRAQLVAQSLVTGKQKVSLGYYPETDALFHPEIATLDEIPTIPAVFDSLTRRIEALPWEEIVVNLNEAIEGLAKVLHSGRVEQTLTAVDAAAKSIESLAASPDLRDAIASLDEMTGNVNDLVESSELTDIFVSIDATLKEARELMEESQVMVQNVRDGADPLHRELLAAMESLVDLTRTAQSFLEYLERHPEALVQGKGSER